MPRNESETVEITDQHLEYFELCFAYEHDLATRKFDVCSDALAREFLLARYLLEREGFPLEQWPRERAEKKLKEVERWNNMWESSRAA